MTDTPKRGEVEQKAQKAAAKYYGREVLVGHASDYREGYLAGHAAGYARGIADAAGVAETEEWVNRHTTAQRIRALAATGEKG